MGHRRDQIQTPCSSPGEQRHVSALAGCRSEATGLKKLSASVRTWHLLMLRPAMSGRDVAGVFFLLLLV